MTDSITVNITKVESVFSVGDVITVVLVNIPHQTYWQRGIGVVTHVYENWTMKVDHGSRIGVATFAGFTYDAQPLPSGLSISESIFNLRRETINPVEEKDLSILYSYRRSVFLAEPVEQDGGTIVQIFDDYIHTLTGFGLLHTEEQPDGDAATMRAIEYARNQGWSIVDIL